MARFGWPVPRPRLGRPATRLRRALAAVGTPLLIACVVTASVPGLLHIRVHWGDTLTAIAARYHTSIEELIDLNHLPGNGDLIFAGQLLLVPGSAPAARPGARSARTELRWVPYRVAPGDCLYCIAERFHADAAAIARHNHLSDSLVIYAGQILYIPLRVRVEGARPVHHGFRVPTGGPSRATVRAMIIRTARAFDVDPALALAISWEESGFQQDVVSAADAIGAMQVVPATGRAVSMYIVRRPLDLYRAADNIVAGVALLGVLTREASVRDAVAGYYQGLASVRENGMYPDTRQYVRTVLALRGYFRHTL